MIFGFRLVTLKALLVLAFCLAVQTGLLAQGKTDSPQPIQPQSSQLAAPNIRGTEELPIVVRSKKTREEATQEVADREDKASTDWWMKIFSGAVALAAFLQLGTFLLMIRTSRRQLRAYIFAEGRKDDLPEMDATKGLRITLRLHNKGQTPAYKLTNWIAVGIHTYPLTETLKTPEGLPKFTAVDLGPNAEVQIVGEYKKAMTTQEQDDVLKGTKRIYIYGEARYHDAFAFWRRRYSKFRYMIPVTSQATYRGILACEEGNEAN